MLVDRRNTRNLPWETFPFVKIPVLIGTYERERGGGWEYEDKTLALFWECEGVRIAAKTRMAHGLETRVESRERAGGMGI